jgi:pimeloyl-ACP methyl ester carboxylesterase
MKRSHRQLVEIGDRVLCVRVFGSGPTVVLEAGGGGDGSAGAFGSLEESLAAFASVVTYDRAGSGRSDGPVHRTVAAMADDLDQLLEALGCRLPVVIVGWSSGGLVAEMFALRRPDKVAGLVLLDPSDMPFGSRLGAARLATRVIINSLILSLAVQLEPRRPGAGRKLARRLAPPGTNSETLKRLDDIVTNPPKARWSSAPVMVLFGRYIRETSHALSTGTTPDVPVQVLVPRHRTGIPATAARRLEACHHSLATRFPRGQLVFVDNAGHALPIDRPDAVLAAVHDVISASEVRNT